MSRVKASIKNNEIDRNGKVNLKIRIFHNGKTRYIGTKFSVPLKQFSVKTGRVLKSHPMYAFINAELKKLEAIYETKLITTEGLETKQVKDIVAVFRKKTKVVNIFELFDERITELKKKDTTTWEKYQTTSKKLQEYHGSRMLAIGDVDINFLNGFMNSRLDSGKNKNTVAIDLRNIRAIFNRAIDDGLITADIYPFRKFKIQGKKTAKRNLTIKQLKAMYSAKLTGKEKQSVDIFFLSFFLIGMNIRDIYRLKPANIRGGRVVYERAKTGKEYSIKIEPEARAIINRYKAKEGEWLLTVTSQYARPYEFTKCVNKFLKRVAADLGIKESVTTYYARHSWATLAYNKGISKDDVRLALGHGTETDTDTYIDFDLALVDKANRKVINLIV